MNKTFKTILAVLVMVFGFGFLSAGAALADPVNPDANELVVNFTPDPLFGDNNFLPGDSAIGEAEVINGTAETKRIATQATEYPKNISGGVPDDDLSRALTIIIREEGGSDIYGGLSPTGVKTLAEFYESGEVYLSSISSGETKTYEFEISFPTDKENKWQEATTNFNIVVGFQDKKGGVVYCNYNGKQDNGEKGIDCGGGGCPACGGGGGVQGLIIKYEQVIVSSISPSTATIKWWTSYNATSQVIYSSDCEYDGTCTEGKKYDFDFNDNQYGDEPTYQNPPKYGYKSTTYETNIPSNPSSPNKVTYREVTITGLNPKTTYHFRCVSHASPPTISRTHTFTTLALADDDNGGTGDGDEGGEKDDGSTGDIGEGTPPETYQRLVAGVTDFVGDVLNYSPKEDNKDGGKELEEKLKDGEVRGEEDEGRKEYSGDDESYSVEKDIAKDEKESIFSRYWWCLFILALLLIIFFFWYRKKKKKEEEIGN